MMTMEIFHWEDPNRIPYYLIESVIKRGRKPKMNIKEFTKEELENELKRREEEERIRDIPKRIGSWDIDGVIDYVENILYGISNNTLVFHDDIDWDDIRIEVYRRFMLEVYGEQIRKWLDKKGLHL